VSESRHGRTTAAPDGVSPHIPTSVLLERLKDEAPAGEVTLERIMRHLEARSFGVTVLLLGICATIPGVSPLVGIMLFILAIEMIRGRTAPGLPRRVSQHPISTSKLVGMIGFAVPVLRFMERFIRPRWFSASGITNRLVAVMMILLGALLFVPVPLSNVPVGMVVVLLAFAYLERDGVLMAVIGVMVAALLAADGSLVWGTISAAEWLTE
jgi:hypothetical protein